jgi:hypothetical protein
VKLSRAANAPVVTMPGARAAWCARSEAGRAQIGHESRVGGANRSIFRIRLR